MPDLTFAIKAWIDEVARDTTAGADAPLSSSQINDNTAVGGRSSTLSKKRRRRPPTATGRQRHSKSRRRKVLAPANSDMTSSNPSSSLKQASNMPRRTSPRRQPTSSHPQPRPSVDNDTNSVAGDADSTNQHVTINPKGLMLPPPRPASASSPTKTAGRGRGPRAHPKTKSATGLSQASQTGSGSRPVTDSSWRELLSTTGTELSRPSQAQTTILSDNTGSRARSQSPIKNTADLRFADIEIRQLADEETFDGLPESARNLITSLQQINDGEEFIPSLIHEQVEAASKRYKVRPHNIISQYHLTPDEALFEFQSLVGLVRNAISCKAEEQSEAAWNALVHSRVFELALAKSAGKSVKSWLTTTAKMIPEVAPRTGGVRGGGGTVAKMVDFCLTIEPTNPRKVTHMLDYQPTLQLGTINQSQYMPLRFRPIAIAVETKVDTASNTGETQLGIWTKAWLNRMCMLLQLPSGSSPSSPPLPMIRIRGHSWYVLIGYLEDSTAEQQSEQRQQDEEDGSDDHGDVDAPESQELDEQQHDLDAAPTPTGDLLPRILVIAAEQSIGDTQTIVGAYKLLRCIRALVDWAESDFRKYIDEVVIPTAEKLWVPS
ncbi:hypothetical protein F5Y10DRAFT_233603 [Nemania abortiva]|nr:hypothetical protein F5Y10DRAFT_233603 [Nemania abortiva]